MAKATQLAKIDRSIKISNGLERNTPLRITDPKSHFNTIIYQFTQMDPGTFGAMLYYL